MPGFAQVIPDSWRFEQNRHLCFKTDAEVMRGLAESIEVSEDSPAECKHPKRHQMLVLAHRHEQSFATPVLRYASRFDAAAPLHVLMLRYTAVGVEFTDGACVVDALHLAEAARGALRSAEDATRASHSAIRRQDMRATEARHSVA